MSKSKIIQNQHLLYRAGFGPHLSQLASLEHYTTKDLWEKFSRLSPYVPLRLDEDSDLNHYSQVYQQNTNSNLKREIQKANRQATYNLNLSFFNFMIQSDDQLREKIAMFWHGHFATRILNASFNVQILNLFREKGLGKFSELLHAVSKSPAMLQFLNNQQNKKDHPNENFAREVMELFTLGRGNYTEQDIKEAARAFTGWGYDKEGNFVFRRKFHDAGLKTFLGKTGNFDGDDILNIILEQPSTARFIITKVYQYFINDKADPQRIDFLADRFRNSGYQIMQLLDDIFSSDWFYHQDNIGVKIKSPIELMVGIFRIIPANIQDARSVITLQRLLGQMLLFPPNVSGWPSGKAWIDSSTLMLRLQLPQILTGLKPLDLKPKEFDDVDMGLKPRQGRFGKMSSLDIDWDLIENAFKGKDLNDFLLQVKSPLLKDVTKKYADQSFKLNLINMMCTPEYQLC